MKIARVKEMQQMDQEAIQKYGLSDELLMENAGIAVCQVIAQQIGIENKRFLIFCGTGNNGGDGLVVARKLYSNGARIRICILNDPEKYQGAARKNWQIIQKLPLAVFIQPTMEEIKSMIPGNDAIVDAIFGTGLTREIKGNYVPIIQAINHRNSPIISIDIPSGINGNNGQISGIAVKADHTITFGLPKLGNILFPGFSHCGKLYVTHISFPPELYDREDRNIQVNMPVPIPDRPEDGHKGTFGNALFVAGARNYYGAPLFSSLSFLKAGGGYSRLAAPASIIPYISTGASEVVFLPQKESDNGTISMDNFSELLKWSEKMDIIVMGPGLSLQEETQNLVRKLMLEIKKPLLIDGDGLTAISQDISLLKKRQQPTILTPHTGEMARLIRKPIEEIKRDPVQIVQDFSRNYDTICLLKGAHSIIGLPDGNIYINMTGNSGMATAGSGDVLTGTIAAMFTLGLPLTSAARQGTLIHGFAGDLAAHQKGQDGITARDILESLPRALKIFRENQKKEQEFKFSGIYMV